MGSFSTAPINIPITATDATGAAFASATRNAQAFAAQSNAAGAGMEYSMRNANLAVRGLGDELGVRMPRFVSSFLAQLPLVGVAMNAAFAPIAIVALIGIVEKLADKFSDVGEAAKKAAEETKKLNEALDRAFIAVGKSDVETGRALELVGASGAKKLAIEYGQTADALERNRQNTSALKDQIYGLEHGMEGVTGNLQTLRKQLVGMTAESAVLSDKLVVLDAQWKFESAKEGAENLKKATAEAARLKKELDEIMAGLSKLPPTNRTGMDRAFPMSMFYSDNGLGYPIPQQVGIQGRPDLGYLKQYEQISNIYNETRTNAEKLVKAEDDLNSIRSKLDPETYARALAQIKTKYDDVTIAVHQFGINTGEALQQALIMGRSWHDVLNTLIFDLARMILQMTVMKQLQGATGADGFFASLLGGFLGIHGSGGFMSAGEPGIVGDRGPELWVPSTSGFVVPNGAFGGVVINNYNDFREANPGSEARISMMLERNKQETVALAISAVREQGRRGPWQ